MRRKGARVKGLGNVLKNLQKHIEKTDENSRKAFQAIGIFVKSESQEITPHSEGVLINSSYYSTSWIGAGWVVRVGYTAKYAPFVHEMPDSTNWSKSGTGNKFLFKAVHNNESKITEILKNRLKV